MLTSSTGMRERASSMNRASMPSYRPQAKISWEQPVYLAALAWVNGTPLGVGTISRGPPLGAAGAGAGTPRAAGARGEAGGAASPETGGAI